MIYNSSIEYTHISPLRWVEPLSDVRYLRKMGATDSWRVQFLSDNNLTQTFTLKVYSLHGFYLCSFAFTKSTIAGVGYYWDAYPDGVTITAAIAALNIHYVDGCVVFKLYADTDLWAESEPVEVGYTDGTMQIAVWHSDNDMGTVFGDFSWSSLFAFRVEATFERGYLKMKGDYETFANQNHEYTVTYTNPTAEYELTIGDKMGLSDDMVEQVYRFLSCDTILIDFTQYTRLNIEEVMNEVRGTRQLKVTLAPATNRRMQNVLGEDILITNEEGNVLEAVIPDGNKLLKL